MVEKNGINWHSLLRVLGLQPAPRIVNEMKRIEEDTDIQIIFFHGGTERFTNRRNGRCQRASWSTPAQTLWWEDIHVLQPMEIYKGFRLYILWAICIRREHDARKPTIIFQAFLKRLTGRSSFQPISYRVMSRRQTNNWQPYPIENKTHKSRVLDFMKGKESCRIEHLKTCWNFLPNHLPCPF